MSTRPTDRSMRRRQNDASRSRVNNSVAGGRLTSGRSIYSSRRLGPQRPGRRGRDAARDVKDTPVYTEKRGDVEVDLTPMPLVEKPTLSLADSRYGAGVGVGSESVISGDGSSSRQVTAGESFFGERLSSANLGSFGISRSVLDSASSIASGTSSHSGVSDDDDGPLGASTFLSNVKDAGVAVIRHDYHSGVPAEELTEETLDELQFLTLTETDTFFLLDIRGKCVSVDDPEADEIRDRRDAYERLKKRKVGNDSYVKRDMQTFNLALKNKDVQVTPTPTANAEVQATQWDIYDAYVVHEEDEYEAEAAEKEAEEDEDEGDDVADDEDGTEFDDEEGELDESVSGLGLDDTDSQSQRSLSSSVMAGASTADASVSIMPTGRGKQKIKELSMEDRFTLFVGRPSRRGRLVESLAVLERIVTQNIYHWRQLDYRDIINAGFKDPLQAALTAAEATDRVAEEESADAARLRRLRALRAAGEATADDRPKPTLELLWSYACSLSQGRNVACVVWNKANPDMLAVGYGPYNYTEGVDGLILVWTTKNPRYPERIIHTGSGVTACDFSQRHPNLLGVGMFDGTVAVFDVRKSGSVPILDSGFTSGKHKDPVWALKWVDRGMEQGEVIVTASTDASVKQWAIKKGLEKIDLMLLKRENNPAKTRAGDEDANVWRTVGGLSLAFAPHDSNVYLVTTEDGLVHRCSCSYNEQYLETYVGHVNAIYKVVFSPFHDKVFLTASADWSVQLWHIDYPDALMSFKQGEDAVNDVAWSQQDACMFASVNASGSVHVWDLSLTDYLDPLAVYTTSEGVKPTTILFSTCDPVVVVGGSEGNVDVIRIKHAENAEFMDDEPARRALAARVVMDATADDEVLEASHAVDPLELPQEHLAEYHRRRMMFALVANCNLAQLSNKDGQ